MHRNHLIEIGQRVFFDGNNRSVMTGIIYQNSDRTKFFSRGVNDPAAIVFSRYVGGCERNLAPTMRNLGRSSSELIMRACAKKNRRTFFCEEQRNGAADTAS